MDSKKTTGNSTTRFSSRVDDYIKYRPHYPVDIIDLLADKCGLAPESVAADIARRRKRVRQQSVLHERSRINKQPYTVADKQLVLPLQLAPFLG